MSNNTKEAAYEPLTTALVKPGRYQHYKDLPYRVIGTARHSETMELLVVYEALYDRPDDGSGNNSHGRLWVRPAKMFTETVTFDGKTVPRFKHIGD
jgi:hypothetical protein